MRTYISIAIAIIFLAGAGYIVTHYNTPVPIPVRGGNNPGMNSTTTSSTGTTSTTKTYSSADVSKHNSGTSCWTTIGGKVYDLTSWISQHPGGQEAILGLCGRDGTQAFVDQHGGSARPTQELATFYIGDLK